VGWFFSLLTAVGGIFAFAIHSRFLKQGRPEFNTRFSKWLLAATFVVSLSQAVLSITLLLQK